VIPKPRGVRNHFQKARRPIFVEVVQGSFGGEV
jgi:hypothetical protein